MSRRRRSPTPSRRWNAPARRCRGSAGCSGTSPAATPTTRCRRSSANGRRSSPPTSPASPPMPRCSGASTNSTRRRDSLGLDAEQTQVLDKTWKAFVRSGARLEGAAKERYKELTQQRARLTTQFGQNVLADEKAFKLVLDGEADLAGLPAFVRDAAAGAAAERGLDGEHVITLSRSLIEPFLTFSTRRDLREQAWKAWVSRGENGGATDNRAVIAESRRTADRDRPPARLQDAMPTSASTRRWPRRRRTSATCSTGSGSRAWRARAPRAAKLQAMAAKRRRQHHDRAVGLAVLRREGPRRRVRSRRGRDQAIPAARPHDRGRIPYRDPAVRRHLQGAPRRSGLSSRRPRLRSHGPAGPPRRAVLSATTSPVRRSAPAPG